MDTSIIFTLFENLPRQGPGSAACTRKMFTNVPGLPEHPAILDVGCGSGMQTIDLARLSPKARITPVDIHAPYLADIRTRAEAAGVAEHISPVQASMDGLPFKAGSFDLLWAEGSIFVIGVERGLCAWKKIIRPGGFFAFTEAVWFTDTPSPDVATFWQENYPDIKDVADIRTIAETAGYSWITSFPLPAFAWWDDYYTPIIARLLALEKKYRNHAEAQEILAGMKREIRIFREYPDEYGYQFILLKNGT
ncbi:MAG: class I SAM-dependent methyltransferase [Methanoregula sp.]|jgi:SAM-dependent methyltransferase